MTEQPELEMPLELLRAKIKVAFPDAAFSGVITGADGLLSEELDEEQALYGALRGRKWSEVPVSIIESNPDGIVLLTDEAFVAFLPAWLNRALTQEKVREMMVYVFSPDVHKSTETTDHRMRQFTSPQKDVLVAFLKYCLEVESSKFVKERARSAVAYASQFIHQ
jgi:hypothetical protein